MAADLEAGFQLHRTLDRKAPLKERMPLDLQRSINLKGQWKHTQIEEESTARENKKDEANVQQAEKR